MQTLLEEHLDELLDECEYLLTTEQQKVIRYHMITYALSAIMDSDIAKEVETLCQEEV